MDSILDKALEFLGRPPTTPEIRDVPVAVVEEKVVPTPTRKYEVITEEDPLLTANIALKEAFPNLIFFPEDLEEVIAWIKPRDGVSLDIETHGHSKRKEPHKKEALSFVKGVTRLVQLSAGGETFTLDAALLPREGVAEVLGALKGKALYLHNAIFDLPRILRHFGVDLLGEDVRDTQLLSRLYRSGQWEYTDTKNGGSVAVTKKHNIGDALFRELGVKIPKATDHRWSEPLTEARLRYATDDVEHLETLYHDLLSKVEEDGMMEAYEVVRSVYPIYMRQQARGVPFDAELYERMRARLKETLEILDTQLREHAPDHPDEGGRWVWRNNHKPEEREGRNGALRALALAGTPLHDLKKSTRLAYMKKYENAPFLETLDQYLRHANLEGDTRGWMDLYHEDGRIYPNVKFFSQVTGRSAYADPALQNIAKSLDLPGMEGTSFRDCIRAPEGSSMVKADYSAQELRILAHVAGDENLLNAFVAQAAGGKDLHLVVGEKIAGKELKKNTPAGRTYRQAGKRANYGFSYGAGWKRYQRSVYEDTAEVITDLQAKKEKWAFEEAWPGVTAWQQAFGDRAGHEPEAWFTRTFLNRRRYVSPGKEGKPNYCDRLNGPIQSGGADQLYLALAKMVEDPFEGVHVIVTTHDEIVLECTEEVAEEALRWLLGHMREAVKETIGDELATPDCVEGEAGRSWGS